MDIQLNADRTQPAQMHGARLAWVPSPEAGVERRMLERSGGEVAVASTIVRYAAGSSFHQHTHHHGEEFIVLDGTFSDERGDYPVGTYVHNPPGSSHAPRSRDGCVIFVKLRQMLPDETESVVLRPGDRSWRDGPYAGSRVADLYRNRRIDVKLLEMRAHAVVPARTTVGGEEIFVIEGDLQVLGDSPATLERWSWMRRAGSLHPELRTAGGALLWVKSGHLR